MKCSKCKKEIDEKCKFCSNCGEMVKEKPVLMVEDLAKTCSKVWYILGYVGAKSTKEELKEFEERIRKYDETMLDWYKEVIAHWKNWVKENNEKDKKANGSKRTGVPKIKRVKT